MLCWSRALSRNAQPKLVVQSLSLDVSRLGERARIGLSHMQVSGSSFLMSNDADCWRNSEYSCQRCVGEGAWWLAPVSESERNTANVQDASTPTCSLFTAAGEFVLRNVLFSCVADLVCAASDDIDLFWMEVRAGANALERWTDGATPLHTAAYFGSLRVVHALIDGVGLAGLDPIDKKGMTPLAHAARQHHEDVVAYLILRGADREYAVNLVDTDGSIELDNTWLLLVGELEPYLPAALEGVEARPADAGVPPHAGDAQDKFAKSWSEDRKRLSRLHTHALVATVADRPWQCDGVRLFGCWQPAAGRGYVRFVCSEGCEFSLCRVCVGEYHLSSSSSLLFFSFPFFFFVNFYAKTI